MASEATGAAKIVQLRYAGRCTNCGLAVGAGTTAIYDRDSRTITCLECEDASETDEPDDDIFSGNAGGSAQREFERRSSKRESRVRKTFGIFGGLALALSDDPQSTRAWRTGAAGEAAVGRRLDALALRGIRVLHDRKIPRTRQNIDHIAVTPAGVWVIDAKKYKGRPTKRVEGGIFSRRVEKLFIDSRNETSLVDGVHRQMVLVGDALEDAGFDDVLVGGMLCFVDAEWPMLSGDFTVDGIHVLWPKRLDSYLLRDGELAAETIIDVHRALATAFRPA